MKRTLWAEKIVELLLMLDDGNCKLDKVSPQDVHFIIWIENLTILFLFETIFPQNVPLRPEWEPGSSEQQRPEQSPLGLPGWILNVNISWATKLGRICNLHGAGISTGTFHCIRESLNVHQSINESVCRWNSRSRRQLWKEEHTVWCYSSAGGEGTFHLFRASQYWCWHCTGVFAALGRRGQLTGGWSTLTAGQLLNLSLNRNTFNPLKQRTEVVLVEYVSTIPRE